jgi:hypothetical protein
MGVVQSVRFTAVCARIAFDRHNASGFADAAGWGAALQTDRAHTTRHVSCGSSDVLLNCLRRPLPLTLQGPFSLLWRSSLCVDACQACNALIITPQKRLGLSKCYKNSLAETHHKIHHTTVTLITVTTTHLHPTSSSASCPFSDTWPFCSSPEGSAF